MKILNDKGIRKLEKLSSTYLSNDSSIDKAEYDIEDFTLKIFYTNGVSHTISFVKPYTSKISTSEGDEVINLPYYVIKRIYALLVPRNYKR